MSDIIFTEWRNNNQQVNYPFIDSATLLSGGLAISRDLFDDARVYPIGAVAGIFLNRISVAADVVTIAIADSNGELATASYSIVSNTADDLELFDIYGRSAGLLVSSADRLATLGNFPAGDTLFTQDATEFVGSVAIPMPNSGVTGLLVDGAVFSGDVWLVGTNGVVLSVVDGSIRIDVIGDPYAQLNYCDANSAPLAPLCALKTINEIPGDPVTGDFKIFPGGNLAPDNMLRIDQTNGTEIGVATALQGGCNGN